MLTNAKDKTSVEKKLFALIHRGATGAIVHLVKYYDSASWDINARVTNENF